jgi:hypothetical protein
VGGALSAGLFVEQSGSGILVSAVDARLMSPLEITLLDPALQDAGMHVNFCTGSDGNTYFAAVLNPSHLFKITGKRAWNILLLWNCTREYYGSGRYYSRYYYNDYIRKEKEGIVNFISTGLDENDRFNVLLNDGTIKSYRDGLSPATSAQKSGLAGFLEGNLNTENQYDCTGWRELVMEGLLAAGRETDSLLVLVIDRPYGRSWYPNTGRFDSLVTELSDLLPGNVNVYGVGEYHHFYVYQELAKKSGGQVIQGSQSNDLVQEIRQILPYFSARLYPSDINFSVPGSFSYDRFGPEPYTFFASAPLLYFGRVYDGSTLNILLNAVHDGAEFRSGKSFKIAKNEIAGDGIAKLWALQKVENYVEQFDYSRWAKKEATELAMEYRILSPYTSLISLEPGMEIDTAGMTENDPRQARTVFTNVVTMDVMMVGDMAVVGPATAMIDTMVIDQVEEVPVASGNEIGINAYPNPFNPAVVIRMANGVGTNNYLPLPQLAIYDTRGRRVHHAEPSSGKYTWNAAGLPSGVYILKVKIGKRVLTKKLLLQK